MDARQFSNTPAAFSVGMMKLTLGSVRIPLRMRLMPGPGGADDFLKFRVFRFPTQFAAGLLGGGDQAGRIARTPRLFDDGNFSAGDLFAGLNHLAHGVTAAVA